MISLVILAAALVVGYLVTIASSLVVTMAIGSAAPRFISVNARIRKEYKLAQDVLWMLCAAAGSYVTSRIAGDTAPWLGGTVLSAVLISLLWWNAWEARQRGMAHQILISVLSVCGVAAGYYVGQP